MENITLTHQLTRLEYKIVISVLLQTVVLFQMVVKFTTWDFNPFAVTTIHFENATYETSETVGSFSKVRLTSSEPFANDTQVTISFEDISATGMPCMSAYHMNRNMYFVVYHSFC